MTTGKCRARDYMFTRSDRADVARAICREYSSQPSGISCWRLGAHTGLLRLGVDLLVVPPAKESIVDHLHYPGETFAFVLAGRGIARIDGRTFEIGPGDFVGLPRGCPAHNISNPFGEEFVCLSGGERANAVDKFPLLGMRVVRL